MQRYGKTLKRDRIFPIFSNFAVKINTECLFCMKYYKVTFTISAPEDMMQDAADIVAALAGEAGFETFEESAGGITGYVQQSLFDESLLVSLLDNFPLPSCGVTFTVSEAEDKDWNEQWEQEGFDPIVVGDKVVVHDGRHLPQQLLTDGNGQQSSSVTIEIDAKLAFGTGSHETTRLMITQLTELHPEGCRVLDCGTGTGILSITALKLGASEAVGYDIDEWCADNARHNAVINGVDNRFTSLLGDSSLLQDNVHELADNAQDDVDNVQGNCDTIKGHFDIVLANINRNILLADMPAFVSRMAPHSTLLLSGFYVQDIPLLTERATALGLKTEAQTHDGDWACLRFRL